MHQAAPSLFVTAAAVISHYQQKWFSHAHNWGNGPADMVAQAHAELVFSRQLEQPWRTSPPPAPPSPNFDALSNWCWQGDGRRRQHIYLATNAVPQKPHRDMLIHGISTWLKCGEDGPSGQQGWHHHAKPVASKKHKNHAWGTHLDMEIYVGIPRTQSVAICHNVTHFCKKIAGITMDSSWCLRSLSIKLSGNQNVRWVTHNSTNLELFLDDRLA